MHVDEGTVLDVSVRRKALVTTCQAMVLVALYNVLRRFWQRGEQNCRCQGIVKETHGL